MILLTRENVLPLFLFVVLILLFGSRMKRFVRNYKVARELRIPILLSPVSWQDPLWMLLGEKIGRFLERLPFCEWALYSRFGWQMHDKYHVHERLGPAFVLVSPAKNEMFIADPSAALEVLTQWKKYPKSAEQTAMFEVLGPNVGTVWNSDWNRHRKITAVLFKESHYKVVWDETTQQVARLMERWVRIEDALEPKEISLSQVIDEVSIVALNVLIAAGFDRGGEGYDDVPEPGHKLSYLESLRSILHNLMGCLMLQRLEVPDFFLPRSLRHLRLAVKEFKTYLSERVDMERQRLAMCQTVGRDNLMSSLVAANKVTKTETLEKSASGPRLLTLSDAELQGNLFTFNLAGYETTAGVLSYAIAWLGLRQDVQEWVWEEVRSVSRDGQDYAGYFPRLTRCLAILVSICPLLMK